jgi:hypothetical protein
MCLLLLRCVNFFLLRIFLVCTNSVNTITPLGKTIFTFVAFSINFFTLHLREEKVNQGVW